MPIKMMNSIHNSKDKSARCWFPIVVFIALFMSHLQGQDRHTAIERGAWSSKAVSLFNTWGGLDSNPDRKAALYSPDRKKTVEINGETVTITIEGKQYQTHFDEKTNAELGWAPDSSGFFLTWTDGGETGSWHVQVYEVEKTGLKEMPGFEEAAEKDFDALIRALPVPKDSAQKAARGLKFDAVYCKPNVVASEWLNGSKELLISVLVPNVGSCRHMSEFSVYRVAVPDGKIIERYTAQEARRKFNPTNLPKISK